MIEEYEWNTDSANGRLLINREVGTVYWCIDRSNFERTPKIYKHTIEEVEEFLVSVTLARLTGEQPYVTLKKVSDG